MQRPLIPSEDRGPLRVLFLNTTMQIGGAEMLEVELVRRLDRGQFLPELVCLKDAGGARRNARGRGPRACQLALQ